MLGALGFDDAAVLNGGWRKWTLEGRPVSTDPRYRWIDALLAAMPSFSSSPRIRSAPQEGLSLAIVAISSRTSALTRGRPIGPRDRQR
jgi:hypothetical protein